MDIFAELDTWEKTEGRALFSAILDVPDPAVLDYGCGFGNYSFAAAYAFGPNSRIYAADIDPRCLEHIDEKAKKNGIRCITTVRANEDYRQPFDDGSFDLVFYSDLFHGEEKHYGGLHRFVMLEEAGRTLKDGGVLAVLPFHLSNFRDREKKKVKVTCEKLIGEIREYGFALLDRDLQGIHFEKAYSPYYQKKGGVSLDSLERGRILLFVKD